MINEMHTGSGPLYISLLLYADNSLIFCEPEVNQLGYLRLILCVFEGVSGLHDNWNKSRIIPANTVQDLRSVVAVLRCRTEFLPSSYLGLPLPAKANLNLSGKEWWIDVKKDWLT